MESNSRKNLVKTFSHMQSRCYNTNDKRYKDWGGRGIKICNEWMNDIEKFIQWAVSNGYQKGLSIDRIDNDGDYCPQNCRWVTLAENNQNRRSSKYYTYNGKTQNLQQWCNEYSVPRSMVNKRLEMGWDFGKALFTPKKTRDCESMIGQKYGRLTVLEFVGVDRTRQSLVKCICDCGNIVITNINKLRTGHTNSCGCYRKEKVYNKTTTFP